TRQVTHGSAFFVLGSAFWFWVQLSTGRSALSSQRHTLSHPVMCVPPNHRSMPYVATRSSSPLRIARPFSAIATVPLRMLLFSTDRQQRLGCAREIFEERQQGEIGDVVRRLALMHQRERGDEFDRT